MKNIIIVVCCLFNFSIANGVVSYAQTGDSLQSRIVFECSVNYNGNPVEMGNVISVEGYSYDSLYISGEAFYEFDSVFVIHLEGDSAFSLTENYQNLEFKFENIHRNCFSYNIEYAINNQLSRPDLIVITSFEIYDHFFTYRDSVFCDNSGIYPAQTDIPRDVIELASSDGILFGPELGINTDKSTPGLYEIHVFTDYCLSPGTDSINVTIEERSTHVFPDSLIFCSNTQNEQIDGTFYEFYLSEDTGFYDALNIIPSSGYYQVRVKNSGICSSSGYVYVKLIEPLALTISQEELCEKAVVEVIPDISGQYSYSWSTGQDTPKIEVTESSIISVSVTDEHGCISTESSEIQYSPFLVESVEFEKEESDCWQDGKFYINSLDVNYDRGEYQYTLVNTITGNRIDNLEEVPEGIYQLEIADPRNCIAEYQEEITILQNCLNDYPVFTPDQDGIEDEYFIPHEGTVKIFDRNGVMLKELNTPAYWDGTDDSGSQMPMGNYVMITESGRVVNITIVR